MKNFFALAVLVAIGGFGWQVGATAHTETVALVVGFVFGAMAAVPASLITLAATRRQQRGWDDEPAPRSRSRYADGYDDRPMLIMQPGPQQPAPPPSNPWVVTGGGSFDDMPAPRQDGRFRMR